MIGRLRSRRGPSSSAEPRLSFSRRLRTAIIRLVVLVLIASATGVTTGIVVSARAGQTQARLEPLALADERALADLTTAQSGLRGYLLAGRPDLLASYWSGRSAFARDSGDERRLAAGDPELSGLVARSDRAAQRWLAYTAPLAAPGASSTPSHSIRGTQLFDAFRAADAALGRTVNAEIAQGAAEADLVTWLSVAAMLAVSLLAIVGGIIVLVRIDRLVSQPLDRTREVLGRLARGERAVRAELAGAVEMRALAESVNALASENDRFARTSQERARLRRILSGLSREIRRDLDAQSVMTQAVEGLGVALDAQRALIRLTAGREGWLGPRMAQWAEPGLAELGIESREGLRVPDEMFRLVQRVASAQDQYAIPDVHQEPDLAGTETQRFLEDNAICSLLSQAVVVDGETLGVLMIAGTLPRRWTADEETMVASVADDLGRALSHARLYADQERLVAQLQELDEAKSVFFSTVSHELRTPLTSVIGYLELLEDDGADSFTPRQREMLATIGRNTERLRVLIEDLLTLSRVEAGTFRSAEAPVTLGPLVENVCASLLPAARQGGVDLRSEVDPGEVRVRGDADQLERAILNLAGNAVKFTEQGGQVRLTLGKDGSDAVLEVADTGIGIPAAEQEAVFERFGRASNARQGAVPGTGLGLAIVHAIVEQHHGTISLVSEEGRGTTVTVRLPLLGGAGDARPAEPQPGSSR